jgi:cell division septation protein DedD
MSSTVANVNEILEEDEGGLSGFTILTILATLLMVFVLVVYYAYKQGMARASSYAEELPVVAADPTPVAEDVPLDVAKSDRAEVYDRITNGTVPTRTVTYENQSEDALSGYGAAPTTLSSNGRPGAPDTSGSRAETEDPAVAAVTTRQPVQSEPRTAQATTAAEPARQPARETPETARTAASTTAPEPQPAPGALSGSHVVQVGAFDSNADALSYFEGMTGKMGTLVSSKEPDVQVAEVKGRTYHRLRIGPFPSKSAANNYCNQLKTRGQDCLVRGV